MAPRPPGGGLPAAGVAGPAIAIDADEVVALAADLVRCPSGNPPGDEAAVAHVLAAALDGDGIEVELQDVAPGRANLVASWGHGDGPVVLLTGHLDTVPVGEGWTVPPLAGEVRDGRLYGRGSADMKGGLAAMAVALRTLARGGPAPAGRVVLAAVADEEEQGAGTRRLLAEGLRADVAVVGEPTELRPAIGCRGNCTFEVVVGGRGAHAGRPSEGVNAIDGAAVAIGAVRGYAAELQLRTHPLLGSPSAVVGAIAGGTNASTVPGSCSFWVDRRLLPGERPADVLVELQTAVARAVGYPAGVTVDVFLRGALPGFETPDDHPAVVALADVLEELGFARPRPEGWPASCDGGYLAEAGIPAIVFGPGSIVSAAHRPDESVAVDELVAAARSYASWALRLAAGT